MWPCLLPAFHVFFGLFSGLTARTREFLIYLAFCQPLYLDGDLFPLELGIFLLDFIEGICYALGNGMLPHVHTS